MLFNVELVDSSITSLSNGKAPGINELAAEHLKYAHSAIALVLTKLFNLMLKCGIVANRFGHGYSVPIPKGHAVVVNQLQLIYLYLSSYLKSFRTCCLRSIKKLVSHLIISLVLRKTSDAIMLFIPWENSSIALHVMAPLSIFVL